MNDRPFDNFVLCSALLLILNLVGSTLYWMAQERWPYLASLRPAVSFFAIGLTAALLTPLLPTTRTKTVAVIMTGTLFVAAVGLATIQFA